MSLPSAALSSLTAAATSPAITRVLFHSGSCSVVETTYLGIALNWSENGSPERLDQTGAKPSYVCRPMSMASHENSSSPWTSSARGSLPRPSEGHRCGASTTPSSVMYVELMIRRIAPRLPEIGTVFKIRFDVRDQYRFGARRRRARGDRARLGRRAAPADRGLDP